VKAYTLETLDSRNWLVQHKCGCCTLFSSLGNVCLCRCEVAGDLSVFAFDFGVRSSCFREDVELQNNTPVVSFDSIPFWIIGNKSIILCNYDGLSSTNY